MSSSLRAGNQTSSDAPIWTHTKDTKINHELDSLKAMWDTIRDTTPGYTGQQVKEDLEAHIRKRAATIRIGASLGFSKVPESELLKDFSALGLSPEAAQQAISAGPARHTRSFRGSSSRSAPRGRGSRRARPASRSA